MSSTGTRKERNVQTRSNEAIIEADKEFINSLKVFSESSISVAGLAGGAISNSPRIPGTNYLARTGDVMIGSIAYDPITKAVSDGRINIFPNDTTSSSYALVTPQGSPDDLHFIDGANNNGQLLHLQGTASVILVLKHATILNISNIVGLGTVTVTTSVAHGLTTADIVNIFSTTNFNAQNVTITVTGATTFTYSATGSATPETSGMVQDGNIVTPDGNDVTLDGTIATNGVPIATLIFDPTVAGFGAWRLVSTSVSVGGGLNTNLSNMTSPTIPPVALSMNAQDILLVDRLLFDQAAGTSLLAADTGITSDAAKNMNFNVPTAANYVYKVNDAAINSFQIGATTILSQTIAPIETTDDLGLLIVPWRHGYIDDITLGGAGNSVASIGHLDFIDNLATPAAAISLYSDGTDLFANTGGGVKNLSNIGSVSTLVTLIAAEPVVAGNLTIFDDVGDMILNVPTGEKVRIREQNATPSIASFGDVIIDLERRTNLNGNILEGILRASFNSNATGLAANREIFGNTDGLVYNTPNTKIHEFRENGVAFLEMDASVLKPSVGGVVDLGVQTTNPFKDLFLSGQANVLGNLTLGGNALLQGNVTLGDSSLDSINFLGTVNTDIEIVTGKKIMPENVSGEIGHLVLNESGSIGTLGTVQTPRDSAGASSASDADSKAGAFTGAMLYQEVGSGSPVLFIRQADGNWSSLTMTRDALV